MAKETLEQILTPYIRPVTEEDKGKLPVYSYSKLDLFESCNYKYKLKYIDKNFDNSDAIHLYLGTLCHKICEIKGRIKAEGRELTKDDYVYLETVLEDGIEEKTDKGSELIIGLKEIKKKYLEDYYTADNATGMNYDEKIKLFMSKVIHEEMEEPDWNVLHNEFSFEFVFCYESETGERKEAIIHGFIDRVDKNKDGNYRVVDYKTSKKAYDPKKMATPLQQCIYGMALFNEYNKLPIEYRYDFIFIDEKQQACTKGYLKRAIKKLTKLLNQIDELADTDMYKPSPTPLCYWCFAGDSPNADDRFKGLCPYRSLWTPEKKTFDVLNKFEEGSKLAKTERKLIF